MPGRGHGPLGQAVVRVLGTDGDVVGAGFVVGRRLIATCAHVVTAAIGGDPESTRPPRRPVRVDFPLADGIPPSDGRVVRWSPIGEDGTGDVAIIELGEPVPDGVRVPPLRWAGDLWGHEFRVFGFPDGLRDGVWASGEFRDRQGTGWLQLHGVGRRVEAGFSGAPVWDADAEAVVGMTVAAEVGQTAAYLIPIERVLAEDPGLLPNPYRGLEPFDERHAEIFHGRDDDIARLADAVRARPIVAVIGHSGTGKSSLLRAGLLPLLRGEGTRVAEFRPLPRCSGLFSFALVLAFLRYPQAPGEEQFRWAAEFADRPPDDGVVSAVAREIAPGSVVLVDQFEEMAAEDPGAAREFLRLVTVMVRASGETIRVVLTLRWGVEGELLTGDVADAFVPVAPMDRAQLRAAIVGPAEHAPGLYFENGLVDRILDDADHGPGQLPLVETLLSQLWAQREGGYLTLEAYERLGGVAGAVTELAEHALAQFTGDGDEGRLRRLLSRLARPDGKGFVRRPVPLDTLPGELAAMARRLVQSRLVVLGADTPAGSPLLELAHQALIDHWPRLRSWLDEDREFLCWRDNLETQLARWEAAGQDRELLLRGPSLVAARRYLTRRADEHTPAERRYVRASARPRGRRRIAGILAAAVVAAATAGVTVAIGEESPSLVAGTAARPEGGDQGTASTHAAASVAFPSSVPSVTPPATGAVEPPSATSLVPRAAPTSAVRQEPSGPAGSSRSTTRPSQEPSSQQAAPPPRKMPDCPAGKVCVFSGPEYTGTYAVLEPDYATGSTCRRSTLVMRSVINNSRENQIVWQTSSCTGNYKLVLIGRGEPDVSAGSYRHS